MKSLDKSYYNPCFSHIYVEKGAWEYQRTRKILEYFPSAEIIEINHYKDVFCRKKQDYSLQHRSQNLILACKKDHLIYPGASVCQNFGNKNFYYTSCIMNCIYDCKYCYLKGMYPSGNIVIFVNLEDYFAQLRQILCQHPVYLCISYDTDLLGMEQITGYAGEWIHFAREQRDLTIELRTKNSSQAVWREWETFTGIILALTLSPERIIEQWEHGTPSLEQRLDCAAFALEQGFRVRLCFDPMIYCSDWREQYDKMMKQVSGKLRWEQLEDVSVGSFRISQNYLKKMRKHEPFSPVAQFPYQNKEGVYQYPEEIVGQMEHFLVERLERVIDSGRIFRWQ